MKKNVLVLLLLAGFIGACFCQEQTIPAFEERLVKFESVLENIRKELKIPGMSAGVVKDGELIWRKGFGYADLENKIQATPDTAYYLASLTKTFASTILMQLVEKGKLDLDDPVGRYGIRIKSPGKIRVRHLFSHTSEGTPGSYYKYDGGRFGHLDKVIKRASGQSFESLLMENIVGPLSMNDTVPGIRREEETYRHILSKMAKPYLLKDSGEIVESGYPSYFGVSAGLISTVEDMAKYIIAIDKSTLIDAETQQSAFSPQLLNSGSLSPYGLGWFVQEFEGTRLIWHYGFNPRIVSTLILYAPEQGMAFLVFANSDYLSQPFWLGLGDVMTSPAALAFVKYFITTEQIDSTAPEIPWSATQYEIATQIQHAQDAGFGPIAKQELISRFMMLRLFGRWEEAKTLLDIYRDLYTQPSPDIQLPRIASIEFVGSDQYMIEEFELLADAMVRVYSVGESDYYRLFDFGGIEDLSRGELVWRMRLEQSEDAGGALKNRKVDRTIELQKGSYRLHYKSDDGHSFSSWNDLPPDDLFWGISLHLADPALKVDDVVGSVVSIQVTPEMRLLDEVEFVRGKPPISPWGYFALVLCFIILASAILFPLIRSVYRRVSSRKRGIVKTDVGRGGWMAAVSWVAAVNGIICLAHVLPALLEGQLERVIANGIPYFPGSWLTVLFSLPLLSVCLVVFLIVALVMSWWKKQRDRPQRIYYTLVVAVAAGYLVLLNHWRVIVLPV
jgi:CubicO group peptidase (beta-lactamase class C family)